MSDQNTPQKRKDTDSQNRKPSKNSHQEEANNAESREGEPSAAGAHKPRVGEIPAAVDKKPTAEVSVSSQQTPDLEKSKKNAVKLSEIYERLTSTFVYSSRNRQRQPFTTPQNVPPPPHYYGGRNAERHVHPPRNDNAATNNNGSSNTQHYPISSFTPYSQLTPFPNIYNTSGQWASYPSRIPNNVPAGLGLLLDCDVLFVIQKIDVISVMVSGVNDSHLYLIINKRGECVYYVTESFNLCTTSSCIRSHQLHILDVYNTEIMYLNLPCACTYCFCCYPILEVYSPPMIPLGAVIKVCGRQKETYKILDSDENVMFKILGPILPNSFSSNDFIVCALDTNETQVGFIRREYTTMALPAVVNLDYYGVTFPSNMDVKVKALIMATVILLSLKRTGWVLRNVEDPETVSGHMYRMSIMTFLIPESSGVDKTRCMKLSLVHDLAECIVGDLTPFCGVDASEKHRQEEVAMKELTQMIGDGGAEIYKLYKEYEAQVTDESKFVKDLDRLDMILQAFEYEKLGDKPGKLEEFFASTVNKFHFPWTIDIVKEIYKQRNLHINKNKSVV